MGNSINAKSAIAYAAAAALTGMVAGAAIVPKNQTQPLGVRYERDMGYLVGMKESIKNPTSEDRITTVFLENYNRNARELMATIYLADLPAPKGKELDALETRFDCAKSIDGVCVEPTESKFALKSFMLPADLFYNGDRMFKDE